MAMNSKNSRPLATTPGGGTQIIRFGTFLRGPGYMSALPIRAGPGFLVVVIATSTAVRAGRPAV